MHALRSIGCLASGPLCAAAPAAAAAAAAANGLLLLLLILHVPATAAGTPELNSSLSNDAAITSLHETSSALAPFQEASQPQPQVAGVPLPSPPLRQPEETSQLMLASAVRWPARLAASSHCLRSATCMHGVYVAERSPCRW